jgi:hypothetical protein
MSHDQASVVTPPVSWHVSDGGLQIWRGGVLLTQIDRRAFPMMIRDLAAAMMDARDD